MLTKGVSLTSVQSPDAVAAILRATADEYRQDAEELRSAWQDQSAGIVWDKLADILDKAALQADAAVAKYFK
jgi:hypothetical protein